MSVRDTIEQRLTADFAPQVLEVVDESHRHRGHAGWREGGETHFRVRISSSHFVGMTRLAQHRAVMQALQSQLDSGVHALAVEVIAPGAPEHLPDRID
jgi:BolA protein